jgi:hypothetical protein
MAESGDSGNFGLIRIKLALAHWDRVLRVSNAMNDKFAAGGSVHERGSQHGALMRTILRFCSAVAAIILVIVIIGG